MPKILIYKKVEIPRAIYDVLIICWKASMATIQFLFFFSFGERFFFFSLSSSSSSFAITTLTPTTYER